MMLLPAHFLNLRAIADAPFSRVLAWWVARAAVQSTALFLYAISCPFVVSGKRHSRWQRRFLGCVFQGDNLHGDKNV